MKYLISIPFLFLCLNPAASQSADYPYTAPRYDFIHYEKNRFIFPGDSSAFIEFNEKFSLLARHGESQMSILHIGGSHLQADIYSDRIRNRFQTFAQGNNGGRGLVFPYSVARTNNPGNYSVSYRGRWESCRNVEERKSCPLGLTGISVTTRDTTAEITITLPLNNGIRYDFNRVRVFCLDDSASFSCMIDTEPGIRDALSGEGYAEWELEGYADSMVLRFSRIRPGQERFTLFGISLETDDPGIIYHAVGVNGAKVPSFLRCSLLPEHLGVLRPDLVVLSIGTNDANTRYFDHEAYRLNYDTLIRRIREVLPSAAILLTVPNDSYMFRRYVNRNTERVRQVILGLAEEHGCGVWDFFSVMGGLNSIWVWQRFGLAKRDRIHFTREGYILKGDLFFDAFLKSYDNFIDQRNGISFP